MATKKYVSLEKLGLYDEKIKALIDSKDSATLDSAKSYADGLADNYEAAGSAATALESAKSYTDTEVAKANSAAAAAKTQADKGVDDAATAQAAAEAAQADVDSLETYVGTIPKGATATNVVAYVQEKTSGIATSENLQELTVRVAAAENDIDALQADHLVAADKTELKGLIETAQSAADAAKTHSEGVATDLATEVTNRTNADSALDNRIQTLESQITGLSGAMHFVGVKESVPEDVSGYAAGDVITVGEKEYVFNGTAFVEFGDVSAEGTRIGNLETKMTAAEGNITQAQADIDAVEAAILLKADQTALDNEVTARTNADTALSGRIATLEAAVGESGSVAEDIADAKDEAVATAAADATSKANAAETAAKTYADGLNTEMDERVDILEADTHTHANKSLLDTYTQTEVDLADAVAKKHSHTNLEVLEGITASKVSAWDAAEQNAKDYAKTYVDGLNTSMDARVAAVESWQTNMIEVSEEEINALFNA